MSIADRLRAKAHAALGRVPGVVGDKLRGANEALGRPLADRDELADRRAFEARTKNGSAAAARPAPTTEPETREAAPVIVYYMEKQKREVSKLTDVLDTQGIKYTVTNIQEDPAAQYAVRRDSNGMRLPVAFIAGECVGGKVELVNLASSGELKKKVFGG
jgi:glutaredoxin-related protein